MIFFEKIVNSVSRFLNWIAAVALLVMMVLTIFNIIIRIPLHSIPGVIEIVSYLFVIVIFFGLAHTTLQKAHVDVDILTNKFSPRAQTIIAIFIGFLGLGIWALITWQGILYGLENWEIGEYSPVLNLKLAPFRLALVIGCVMLCLVLLFDFLKLLVKGLKA